MIEIWKDIKGYEGIYKVSNFGNVKSLDKVVKSRLGNATKKGKMMRQNKKDTGYLHISLRNNGEDKSFSVHRLVALTFIENTENKATVNHKNGIKTDNRIENLEWCTSSENVIHSFATGLKIAPHGSLHYRTKFSDQKIAEIKEKYKQGGVFMKSIAIENNVSVSAICNIINGKRWRHLKTA